MARKAAGEEPLPEEDPSNPIFKPIPEPSRLEGYLVTNQISSYCNHINGYRFLTVTLYRVAKLLHDSILGSIIRCSNLLVIMVFTTQFFFQLWSCLQGK